MADFVKTAIPNRYVGASTDTKPTGVGVGSMCYEHNTGKTFVTYDGTNWVQYAPAVYLSDVVPLADDTSYLGTSALGWKGLYLPDTLIVDDTGVVKIRNVANDADLSLTALNLTLSGTTTALTFSGAATIVAGSGLTIPAFTLGGKLTAGSSEIEGSAFDINGGTIASVTLDGSIAGGDQSWTNVGDMTFAAGSILASGSTNGNTLLFRANDTTFLTFTTGTTDTLTLNNDLSVASGIGILFDTYGIKITDTYIQFGDDATALGPKLIYGSAIQINVRNAANDAYANIAAGSVTATDGFFMSAGKSLNAVAVDDGYATLKARDSGVGLVEIARLAGAADPYFATGNNGNAAKFYYSGAVEIVGASTFTGAATFNGDVVMGTSIIDDDSGAVTLVDMDVTDAPVAGTEQSYAFKVDGTMIAKVYAEADSAGGIQNPAFVIGTGVPIKGHSWVVENHTAGDTLTLAESGSIHTNYGAGGAVALKLPASATAGTTFKFVASAAQELRVVVAASGESFIVNGGTSTDDTGNDLYLVADDEGEMATFTCIAAGVWLVDVVGTWTPTQP